MKINSINYRLFKKKNNHLIVKDKFVLKINASHLCSYCANGYVNKCPKIADIKKKKISEYGFITDGYQLIDDEDKIDTFIVTKCKNFTNETKEIQIERAKDNIKRLRLHL